MPPGGRRRIQWASPSAAGPLDFGFWITAIIIFYVQLFDSWQDAGSWIVDLGLTRAGWARLRWQALAGLAGLSGLTGLAGLAGVSGLTGLAGLAGR